VLCTGAAHTGVMAPGLPSGALRRVRLQMMETGRYTATLITSLADGDSLRYYPGYDVPSRADLQPQAPIAAKWAAQLLVVQRLDGGLTVGDTHTYDEPFPFDLDEAPDRHLQDVANALLGEPLPPVVRRWAGVYSQVVDPEALYLRTEIAPGVQIVTGAGGRGMTLAPAIAAETFS
jgi:glycine/D-amino acid oxidase-like deaminating enzyme